MDQLLSFFSGAPGIITAIAGAVAAIGAIVGKVMERRANVRAGEDRANLDHERRAREVAERMRGAPRVDSDRALVDRLRGSGEF